MKLQAPLAPASIASSQKTLKILPLSDLHLTASPTATQKIVSNSDYFAQMEHVVLLGDMVGNYGTDGEYAALQQFIGDIQKPYSAINGNHEFYFRVYHENSADYRRLWKEASQGEKVAQLEKFKTFFGIEQLWRVEHHELGMFIFLGLEISANRWNRNSFKITFNILVTEHLS